MKDGKVIGIGYSTSSNKTYYLNGVVTVAEVEGAGTDGYAIRYKGDNSSSVSTIDFVGDVCTASTDYTGEIFNDYTNNVASGLYSHAEGSGTTASGDYSHAEGYGTRAIGDYSHAEGYNTTASGSCSHAEGNQTGAIGNYSHAEGYTTSGYGQYSHSEGYGTIAYGQYSHSEGYNSQTVTSSTVTSNNLTVGTTTTGYHSHAEGNACMAKGNSSHAEGKKTFASGVASHAEGSGTTASGPQSHAEGSMTIASGDFTHAEGYNVKLSGLTNHGEGGSNQIAGGHENHIEGYNNSIYGTYTSCGSVMGASCSLSALTDGSNLYSTCGGLYSRNSASYTFTYGTYLTGNTENQYIFGKYNATAHTHTASAGSRYIIVIGWGTGSSSRTSRTCLTTAGTWSNTSDRTLKDDISDIDDNMLNAIGEVPFKQFKWRGENLEEVESAETNYGVIAQDVVKSMEEHGIDSTRTSIVDGGGGAYYGVAYTQLLCVKCAYYEKQFKELDEKCKYYEDKIAEYEAFLNNLEEN